MILEWLWDRRDAPGICVSINPASVRKMGFWESRWRLRKGKRVQLRSGSRLYDNGTIVGWQASKPVILAYNVFGKPLKQRYWYIRVAQDSGQTLLHPSSSFLIDIDGTIMA